MAKKSDIQASEQHKKKKIYTAFLFSPQQEKISLKQLNISMHTYMSTHTPPSVTPLSQVVRLHLISRFVEHL